MPTGFVLLIMMLSLYKGVWFGDIHYTLLWGAFRFVRQSVWANVKAFVRYRGQ